MPFNIYFTVRLFAIGLVTQEESHSGGTAVEVYTTAILLSTLKSQLCCHSSGLDSTVTAIAATVCQ